MIFHSKKTTARNDGNSNSRGGQYKESGYHQQSVPAVASSIKLNPEQQSVIDCLSSEEENVDCSETRLIARAGSGKTTVIAALCHELQYRNISYIVFNKSAKEHFFTRVDNKYVCYQHNKLVVNTMHGYCLKWFQGWRKSKKDQGKVLHVENTISKEKVIVALEVENIIQQRLNEQHGLHCRSRWSSNTSGYSSEAIWVAQCLLRSLDNFTNSAVKTVTTKHLCNNIKPSELKLNTVSILSTLRPLSTLLPSILT